MTARIAVIEPAQAFSVMDVCDGLCAGLRANDCEVLRYPLSDALAITSVLHSLAVEYRPEIAAAYDPHANASHALTNWCYWKHPDAVIAVTGDNLHFMAVQTLRRMGFPTAILCTEAPYRTTERERHDAAHYDYVFTNERKALPLYTFNDPARVHYLPHAYSLERHTPGAAEDGERCDVLFVGTGFDERKALFGAVDWAGIDFRLQGTAWDAFVDAEMFVARIRDNADVVRGYRAARVNLNHHRTTGSYHDGTQIRAGDAESLGPRAYEIAACGGFQLADDSRPELDEVFGGSVPTYRAGDSADLERQIRYWLAHDDARERMAAEQHEAVLPHSWAERAWRTLSVVLNGGRGRALLMAAQPSIGALA